MNLPLTAGIAGAVLALPLFAASFSSPAEISVGSTPTYAFREAPVNAMGVKGLGDLQGKPVLVEFWGTK